MKRALASIMLAVLAAAARTSERSPAPAPKVRTVQESLDAICR